MITPLSVPKKQQKLYIKNYQTVTKNTDKLFLFAADQKMEHLNEDFFGPSLPEEINMPEHVFEIAKAGNAGAFATHLGLIDRYAHNYPTLNYIAKLNGKTHKSPGDPYSNQLWSIEQVLALRNTGINICGIGYTIYLGSEHEHAMMHQAANLVFQAHQHGLLAILWIYPRGKNIEHEKSAAMLAGAAGVAVSLGADFVKIHAPESGNALELRQAVQAAGNTKVIVSGGATTNPQVCLEKIMAQLTLGTVAGVAIGRNIFQHPLKEAIILSNKIADLIYR